MNLIISLGYSTDLELDFGRNVVSKNGFIPFQVKGFYSLLIRKEVIDQQNYLLIQKLQNKVQRLRSQIVAVESKNDELKREVESLKSKVKSMNSRLEETESAVKRQRT